MSAQPQAKILQVVTVEMKAMPVFLGRGINAETDKGESAGVGSDTEAWPNAKREWICAKEGEIQKYRWMPDDKGTNFFKIVFSISGEKEFPVSSLKSSDFRRDQTVISWLELQLFLAVHRRTQIASLYKRPIQWHSRDIISDLISHTTEITSAVELVLSCLSLDTAGEGEQYHCVI